MAEAWFDADIWVVMPDGVSDGTRKVYGLLLECQKCQAKYVLVGSLPCICPHCGTPNTYPPGASW